MNKKILISLILLIVFFINFICATISMAVNEINTNNVTGSKAENTNFEDNLTVENENILIDDNQEKIQENDTKKSEEILNENENTEKNDNKEIKNKSNKENLENIQKEDEKKDIVEENSTIDTLSVTTTEKSNNDIKVTYQGQGEAYGWQSWVSDGKLAGTDGESKRLEGIRIKLENPPEGVHIQYRVHGQDYGWQSWVSDGELAGTDGESRRIEAIEIRLVNMDDYFIEYRVQGQDYGWQSWVSDGELAGTTGQSRRVEGIQIRLVKKDKESISIKYQGQGEGYGWQSWVSDGKLAGTNGESKRLEGIKIKLENVPDGAKIIYQAHGQGYGWQNYVSNSEYAGTVGESKRLEAIKIQLVNLAGYSVQYRAQVEDYGWLSWVSDGEIAGTVGESKRLEGIEIKIVPKIKKSKIEIEKPTRTVLTSSSLDISGYAISEYENTILKLYVDSNLILTSRTVRKDVFSMNSTTSTNIKVNYGDSSTNPTPGFTANVNLEKYKTGKHTITAKLYDSTEKTLLASTSKEFAYYTDRTYGIDVSKYQESINWSQVKNNNVDFAMIRMGLRGYEKGNIVFDNCYEANINGALNNGIKCGIYFFTQAINREEGIEEANWVLENIKGKDITYPIAIDTEWSNKSKDGRADNISVSDRTEAIKGFVETIHNAGYVPIIYANKDWLANQLDMSKLTGYDVWLAHYVAGAPDNTSDYKGYYTMWQYSSKGSIDGIYGYVDMNICYKKY